MSIPFSELSMTPEIRRAVEDMGFDTTTDIQEQSIPLIQQGVDVIGRSQTGTGKTIAFGIPAIETVDTSSEIRNTAQVLILCPTRELAVQACEEIKKLARYTPGIRTADVYGGAPMDRQILKLRTANIVVGTPGRVMDHMRRRTLKLDNLKMMVLDEADEMLSMGFREDIETILSQTPSDRQTVLFSATMPPSILALTRTYQKDPQMVQIRQKQETVENIEQTYYDVPMGRKMDALNLILRFHAPRLAMIFCNTKRMVDDITVYLCGHGFQAEGLHGDMKQSQRTKVMDAFKNGRSCILVATDVAARGIDVHDIDYVINYDIPQNTEYYIHRIGRTGRAGKSGKAVTICSGRRQVGELMDIARMTRSSITRADIPTPGDIRLQNRMKAVGEMEECLAGTQESLYGDVVAQLVQRGFAPEAIAAAALEKLYGGEELDVEEIAPAPVYASASGGRAGGRFQKITISIGRQSRVAPNHIVAAITGCTDLSGRDIGKIEIYDDETVVSIPENAVDSTIAAMADCRITGKATVTKRYSGTRGDNFGRSRDGYTGGYKGGRGNAPRDGMGREKDYRNLRKKSYSGGRRSEKYN